MNVCQGRGHSGARPRPPARSSAQAEGPPHSPVCFLRCVLHLLMMGTLLATPRQSLQAGPHALMSKHPYPSEAVEAPGILKPPDTLREGVEEAQSSSSGGRLCPAQLGLGLESWAVSSLCPDGTVVPPVLRSPRALKGEPGRVGSAQGCYPNMAQHQWPPSSPNCMLLQGRHDPGPGWRV